MNKPMVRVLLKHFDGHTDIYPVKRSESYVCKSQNGGYESGTALFYELKVKQQRKFVKQEQYCFVKGDYEYEYIDGYRVVGQLEGSCGAVHIFGNKTDAPGENYALLMRTHAFAQAYRTLVGERKFPIVVIWVFIAVIVLAFVAYMVFGRGEAPTVTPGDNPDGNGIKIEAVQ